MSDLKVGDKTQLVQLAEYVIRTAVVGSEMAKLAESVLMTECGPCRERWHEIGCQRWAGHSDRHHGQIGQEAYATWS